MSNKIYKLENSAYLQSEAVHVFPCSGRGYQETSKSPAKVFDPEAKYTTEHNLTAKSGHITDLVDSYIDSWSSAGPLICCINGYYFNANLTLEELINALSPTPEVGTSLFAKIRLEKRNIYQPEPVTTETINEITEALANQVSQNVAGSGAQVKSSTDLDNAINAEDLTTYYFTGLSFLAAKQPPITTNVNFTEHSLKLATYTGTNWELNTKVCLDYLLKIHTDTGSISFNNCVAEGDFAFATGKDTSASGAYSHAEGNKTEAIGDYSHAEGNSSITRGANSHAEGQSTSTFTESSVFAHAEGKDTIAYSTGSHAEGFRTKTTDNESATKPAPKVATWAHAEGNSTKAYGAQSHAEGINTIASNTNAHAEGEKTTASGKTSHSEGFTTIASGDYSHAEGDSCKAYGKRSHAEGHKTQTSKEGVTDKYAQHAEGTSTKAIGLAAHAEGASTTADGYASHAEGQGTATSTNAKNAHAEGKSTVADAENAHAEGANTTASGESSHTEGFATKALGQYSHAEGNKTNANSTGTHAEGYNTKAGTDSDSGQYSHAEGYETVASGSESHSEGSGTIAEGSTSHAEGDTTTASGQYSHAEGYSTKAREAGSHAEGFYTEAIGKGSHAEGNSTLAIGDYSHAEGDNTIASGDYSHAAGFGTAEAMGPAIRSLDWDSEVPATLTITGYSSFESDFRLYDLISIPYLTTTDSISSFIAVIDSVAGSTIICSRGAAKPDNYKDKVEDQLKKLTGIAFGNYSQVLGDNTIASGDYSCAEGEYAKADGRYSHAEGSSGAFGDYSHAEGDTTEASGDYSHTEGSGTFAKNQAAHAEGYATNAEGDYSHAEGEQTFATNQAAHAEGYQTRASGAHAHAEGIETSAINPGSHAEGLSTQTSADYQHVSGKYNADNKEALLIVGNGTAESARSNILEVESNTAKIKGNLINGNSTNAATNNSHAEGEGTKASGTAAHSEGYLTAANIAYAHAEGANTDAIGRASHAEGYGTIASGDYSHTEGYAELVTKTGILFDYSAKTISFTLFLKPAEQIYYPGKILWFTYSNDNYTTVLVGKMKITAIINVGSGIAKGMKYECKIDSQTTVNSSSEVNAIFENAPNQAIGKGSHAEGIGTKALGFGSHAEGLGTIASAAYQHVSGKYNEESENALLIIGNGTGDTDRSNVVSVYPDGVHVQNDLYIEKKIDENTSQIVKVFDRFNTIEKRLDELGFNEGRIDEIVTVNCTIRPLNSSHYPLPDSSYNPPFLIKMGNMAILNAVVTGKGNDPQAASFYLPVRFRPKRDSWVLCRLSSTEAYPVKIDYTGLVDVSQIGASSGYTWDFVGAGWRLD